MRIGIEVKDRKQGELIREGLSHDDVRAFVTVYAALARLSSDRARARVINFFTDQSRDPDRPRKVNGPEVEEHDDVDTFS